MKIKDAPSEHRSEDLRAAAERREDESNGSRRDYSESSSGMTQVFADDGTAVGCTVLQAGPCVVVQRRTKDKDGYDAAQLGLVEFVKPQRVNKAHDRAFQEGRRRADALSRRSCSWRIRRTKPNSATACWSTDFKAGELVDVSGVSKGKGFAGRREALALRAAATQRTVPCFIARRAASAAVRFRRACGRASIFPDTWETNASHRRRI